MPLIVSDEFLQAAGKSARDARLDLACRWFDEGRLSHGQAARLGEVSEAEFDSRLAALEIPRYRYMDETLERDAETLKKLGRW